MPNGNAETGKTKAFSCQFCHGATGKATQTTYPNLNGQDALYLFRSMQDYQQDRRTGPLSAMMKQQLSALDEQDLADVAAFYAEQN